MTGLWRYPELLLSTNTVREDPAYPHMTSDRARQPESLSNAFALELKSVRSVKFSTKSFCIVDLRLAITNTISSSWFLTWNNLNEVLRFAFREREREMLTSPLIRMQILESGDLTLPLYSNKRNSFFLSFCLSFDKSTVREFCKGVLAPLSHFFRINVLCSFCSVLGSIFIHH